MSVTMNRSGLSLASSSFSRGTGGAMKTSYSRPVAGSTTSSSSFSSTRTSKPPSRSLPYGPGPTLPNRPTIDHGKFKFIASHSGTSTSREGTSHVNSCHRPSAKNSATTQRKASDDSGYGRSGKDYTYASNFEYGSLAGRKSKSFSQLYSKDKSIDSSPYYRTRTESVSNRGVSEKMGSHHTSQRSTERDYLSSKHCANTNTRQSLYQSTTHSDFRDPKAEDSSTRTSFTKPAYSRTLDRDTGYGNKNNVNIIDVEKSRKATITASPADLKCSRRSSLSSSNNSSPSVSEWMSLCL